MSLVVFIQITTSMLSIIGAGFLGAWLTHRRLSPKSKAEAREITAAAIDKDWGRFQREINRLVKRLEDAEAHAAKAIHDWLACEERESKLKARVLQLEMWQEAQGEGRKLAAGVVALERRQMRRDAEDD